MPILFTKLFEDEMTEFVVALSDPIIVPINDPTIQSEIALNKPYNIDDKNAKITISQYGFEKLNILRKDFM